MDKWIVCLKHGTKYSVDYVNILYNMVKRHNTYPINFACITENPIGLSDGILHIPLPSYNLYGWWFKPWVFSAEFPLSGEIMFMDLDVVIIDNMDNLWDYNPGSFCIIRDFIKEFMPWYTKFNSSIFKFNSGQYKYVWNKIANNPNIIKQYHGDQDYITEEIKDYTFWPDEWIRSYKWEIRSKEDLTIVGGKLNFKNPVDVKTNAKILVFHGEPKPELVLDPIVLNNWR